MFVHGTAALTCPQQETKIDSIEFVTQCNIRVIITGDLDSQKGLDSNFKKASFFRIDEILLDLFRLLKASSALLALFNRIVE